MHAPIARSDASVSIRSGWFGWKLIKVGGEVHAVLSAWNASSCSSFYWNCCPFLVNFVSGCDFVA